VTAWRAAPGNAWLSSYASKHLPCLEAQRHQLAGQTAATRIGADGPDAPPGPLQPLPEEPLIVSGGAGRAGPAKRRGPAAGEPGRLAGWPGRDSHRGR